MPRSFDVGGWTTGFYAAFGVEPSREQRPVVLVMDPEGSLAASAAPLCDTMQVTMLRVTDLHMLRRMLWLRRPVGLMCSLDCVAAKLDTPTLDGRMMHIVMEYDCALPLLLVTGDAPDMHGAVDALEALWRLRAVSRVAKAADTHEIVAFLFRANRRTLPDRRMAM